MNEHVQIVSCRSVTDDNHVSQYTRLVLGNAVMYLGLRSWSRLRPILCGLDTHGLGLEESVLNI